MGEFVMGKGTARAALVATVLIVSLNVLLIAQVLGLAP
jgi:hypothetical protein